jgi:hypothetical protein
MHEIFQLRGAMECQMGMEGIQRIHTHMEVEIHTCILRLENGMYRFRYGFLWLSRWSCCGGREVWRSKTKFNRRKMILLRVKGKNLERSSSLLALHGFYSIAYVLGMDIATCKQALTTATSNTLYGSYVRWFAHV